MNEANRKLADESAAAERGRAGQRSSDSPDRVAALCERVREVAASVAQDAIEVAHQQADALLAEATTQAESEHQAYLAKAGERLQKQLHRQLQNTRLEARARFESCRWEILTRTLDEAEQHVLSMRDADPQRYNAALVRFVQSACKQLACARAVVMAHAEDIGPLQQRLQQSAVSDIEIEIVAGDIAAGVIVSQPDGNVIVDHSITRRRHRCDAELRLAASETLFADIERDTTYPDDAR